MIAAAFLDRIGIIRAMVCARLGSLMLGLTVAFAGCATEDTALARRVRGIKARHLTEVEDPSARLELKLSDGATTWCPNSLPPSQLRAIVHTHDADLLTPVRSPTGPVGYLPQSAIEVKISPGTLGPEWTLLGPSQPSELMTLITRPVVISGHLPKQPSVSGSLQLSTSFDCDQAAEFPGRPGREGGKGGRPGEKGEDGLDVAIGVSYLNPSVGRRLVLVKAAPSIGVPLYFLLTPGRRLGINVRGGDGGDGGSGLVEEVRFSGGLGGDGGNGGRVVVSVDPRFPELRSLVTVVNPGGRGGNGGSGGDRESRGAAGRPGRPGPPVRHQNQEPEETFVEEIEAGVPILGSGSTLPI